MNNGFIHREQISKAAEGVSVLVHLTERHSHSSREIWLRRLENGEVTLEGATARGEERVIAGQWLTWHRPPWLEPEAPLAFEVLYADATLVAVAKPPGLPTLPGGGFLENTLLARLRIQFPDASPAHRLGRWTSGVVVCPRSAAAADSLLRVWTSREVEKTYLALASGRIEPAEIEVTAPIGPVHYPPLGTVHAVSAQGRPSRSSIRVIERRPDSTLTEVRISTGRPHQIRIHLATIGHPLTGDPLYAPGGAPIRGGRAVPGDPGYLLHAWKVTLPHPETGVKLELLASPPAALQAGAAQPDAGTGAAA